MKSSMRLIVVVLFVCGTELDGAEHATHRPIFQDQSIVFARFRVNGSDVSLVQSDSVPLQERTRESVPSTVAQRNVEKQVRSVFKAEFAALKKNSSEEVRADLISKLRSHAAELDDDSVSRFVVLRLAGELAAKATDVETSLKIMSDIARLYDVDEFELMAESLSECLSSTRVRLLCRNIARKSILLSEDATRFDSFDGAIDLLKVASLSATKAKDREFTRSIAARRRAALDLKKQFTSSVRARETLQEDPDNATANQKLGTYLCVIKQRWSEGVPYLAKSSIPGLKKAAELDLQTSDSKESAQHLRTADAWWEIGQKRRGKEQHAYSSRAAEWYEKAYADLSGLKKTEVDKRLRELNRQTIDHLMGPGLLQTAYPIHKSQDNGAGLVPESDLGAPAGPPMVLKSISPYNTFKEYPNVYVVGYLKIDKPGEYGFRSRSDYERDTLTVNGQLLDPYQKTPITHRIRLDIGMVPILCVGTLGSGGRVNVQWQPPGATELQSVPADVLFHRAR